MAVLTVQEIDQDGVTPVYAAANSQDTFQTNRGNDRDFLHVKNGGGGSINVTIPAVEVLKNVGGVGPTAIDDQVVAVPAGAERIIGPITPAFATMAGTVTIDYSGTTSVTAGVFRLPKLS